MKIRYLIAAGTFLAVSPVCLLAINDQKAERERPEKSAWGTKKRDTGHVQQQRMRERGMRDRGFMMQLLQNARMAEAVGITDEQRSQLQTAAATMAESRKALQVEMKNAAMAQAKLLTDQTVDEAAVMAAVEQIGTIRTELAKLEIRSFLSSREILTDEQRKKIKEMMKHRMVQREKAMQSDRMPRSGQSPDRPRKPFKERLDRPTSKKSDIPAAE